MQKNISLLITLFIASTLLVAAEPLNKKTKPLNNSKGSQLNKVKPAKEKGVTTNIVKPMKKKPRKPSKVQDELELLRKKLEAEKLLINNDYKKDLKILKNRKKEALDELKVEYRKKRALLRNK
tara:strand:- start:1 stop:369 length:369 start_codon:yes stop_codon:yes gene_type:complete